MLVKSRILSLLMVVLLFACQKENTSTPEASAEKKITDLWSAAANPSNPEEGLRIGVYHNHGLQYFGAQRASYSDDASWAADVYNHTLDFLCQPEDQTYCDPSLTTSELSDWVADIRTNFPQVIQNSPANVQNYVNDILATFDAHDENSYDAFKDDIMTIEDAVIADNDLKQEDRQMLLITAQVARYSGFYWSEQIANGMDDFRNVDNLPAARINWGDVGKEDAKGAVKGFIGGLFSGNPLGGAAAGALAGSAVEIIDQLL